MTGPKKAGRSAPHLEGFQQQGVCVVARAGKGLPAVRELVCSLTDFRKDEGFQRPNKLVKTSKSGSAPGLTLFSCLRTSWEYRRRDG